MPAADDGADETAIGKPPVVLFHGWGFDHRIWEPIKPLLANYGELIYLDLSFNSSDPDLVCQQLLAELPEVSILCGWSLGGMLATRLAANYPDRVRGLITLAANARFVAADHWPTAMAIPTFEQFYQKVCSQTEKGLQRFCRLVCHGDQQSEQQLQWLQSQVTQCEPAQLILGLELLQQIDNSELLAHIQSPSLHLFGDRDVLVPVTAADAMAQGIPNKESVRVLTNFGHLLHYPITRVEPYIKPFINRVTDND